MAALLVIYGSRRNTFCQREGIRTKTAHSGRPITVRGERIPIYGQCLLLQTVKGGGDFEAGSYEGRIIHFGVREHAMGSTLTGISLNGGLIPYGGTFMTFSDYMRPAIRLAALSEVQVIYVFTHDSIGLGEDGPTHQPIEHVAALRAIPHLFVIRPADPAEVSEAWRIAILRRQAPTALALTRQKVGVIDRSAVRKSGRSAARRLHSRRGGSPKSSLTGEQ